MLISTLGGSAGCVVAGRLAALDRNLKVLLIEGGENNLNNPWVYRHAYLGLIYMNSTDLNIQDRESTPAT